MLRRAPLFIGFVRADGVGRRTVGITKHPLKAALDSSGRWSAHKISGFWYIAFTSFRVATFFR